MKVTHCPYTGVLLPLDSQGKTHFESTQALTAMLSKVYASEKNHRAFICKYNTLASNDPELVLLGAYGLCGLRAARTTDGGVAYHCPPGMAREVLEEKVRSANLLAVRSLQLVHGVPVSSTVGNKRINRRY